VKREKDPSPLMLLLSNFPHPNISNTASCVALPLSSKTLLDFEMSSLKIALADDHPILRETIKTVLSGNDGIEVIAAADDGVSLISQLTRLAVIPDIVILDYTMPCLSGPELVVRMRRLFPSSKILMFSMHAEKEFVTDAIHAGANGYLLKGENAGELFAAIDSIQRGNVYTSPSLHIALTA
jgi:two-component system, NarL family, response regulator NreC